MIRSDELWLLLRFKIGTCSINATDWPTGIRIGSCFQSEESRHLSMTQAGEQETDLSSEYCGNRGH
jgi:hypothetical protein